MASISDLLIARGEQEADSRRRRAAVWTPTVQQLAGLPPQIAADSRAAQDRAVQQREQQQRMRVNDQQIAQNDREAKTQQSVVDHQHALALVIAQPGIRRDDGTLDVDAAVKVARDHGLDDLTPDLIGFGQKVNDAALNARKTEAEIAAQDRANQPQGFTLTPGQQRFNAQGQSIASVPDEVKPDSRPLNVQLASAIKGGDMASASAIRRAIREAAEAGRDPNTSQPATLASLTPADQTVIDAIKDYRQVLPTGIALTKGKWPAYLEAAHVQDPNFDQSQYQVRQKLKQSFSSGKDADNIRGLNTAVGHLGSLAKAMEDMQNGDFESVNSVKNFLSTKMPVTKAMVERQGKQTRVRLDFNAVKGELAGIFKASGATDQEIKSWESTLPKDPAAATPEERKAFIAGTVELMGSRMGANRQKYESGMGGRAFPRAMLSSHSRNILSGLGIDVKAIDPTGGDEPAAPPSAAPVAPAGWKYVPKAGGGWTAVEAK